MSDMDWESFFTLHDDLPREGPGSDADVDWACALAGIAPDATICDVGSGPGGDVAPLLAHVPQGRVLAMDMVEGFVRSCAQRFAGDPRVSAQQFDMAQLPTHSDAPFDMIWSAGALYFLGLEAGPATMAQALRPGGVLAFSEPCLFTDGATDAAQALFEDYPVRDRAGILAAVEAAGFTVLGDRRVSDAGWEAYYQPMEARIAALRPQADARLTQMLDLCAQEAETWRRHRHDVGYLLVVARRA